MVGLHWPIPFQLANRLLKNSTFVSMNCLLGAILLAMVVGSSGQIPIVLNPLHILGGFNVFLRAREPYYVRSSFLAPMSMLTSVHMSL
jgi:hypothetical protein